VAIIDDGDWACRGWRFVNAYKSPGLNFMTGRNKSTMQLGMGKFLDGFVLEINCKSVSCFYDFSVSSCRYSVLCLCKKLLECILRG
jgi:hypothetical protein